MALTRGPFLQENTLEKQRRFRHSRDTTCGSQTEAGLGGSSLCAKWPRGREQEAGQQTSVTDNPTAGCGQARRHQLGRIGGAALPGQG